MSDMEEARKAMIAKRFGGNNTGASTGGGGSVRRKKKGSAKAGGGSCDFDCLEQLFGLCLIGLSKHPANLTPSLSHPFPIPFPSLSHPFPTPFPPQMTRSSAAC